MMGVRFLLLGPRINMFVCIEAETTELEVWNKIDSTLANEFGLTHILWGVDTQKDNNPVACKLPSNLFCGEVSNDLKNMCNNIRERLKYLDIDFTIITMPSKGWSYREYYAPKCSIQNEILESINRIE